MTAPILKLTNCCCNTLTGKVSPGIRCGLMGLDALISISSLVVGILGATVVISMPAAAAYGLIGVFAGITLLYIATCIKQEYCPNNN